MKKWRSIKSAIHLQVQNSSHALPLKKMKSEDDEEELFLCPVRPFFTVPHPTFRHVTWDSLIQLLRQPLLIASWDSSLSLSPSFII